MVQQTDKLKMVRIKNTLELFEFEVSTAYLDEFKNLNSIRKELLSLETDEDEKQRKAELLKYQIKEIKDANLKVGEYEKLKSLIFSFHIPVNFIFASPSLACF